MTGIQIGDIVTFGDDPQRWKAVAEGIHEGIDCVQLVPIDENGEQISLEEVQRIYARRDLKPGRSTFSYSRGTGPSRGSSS